MKNGSCAQNYFINHNYPLVIKMTQLLGPVAVWLLRTLLCSLHSFLQGTLQHPRWIKSPSYKIAIQVLVQWLIQLLTVDTFSQRDTTWSLSLTLKKHWKPPLWLHLTSNDKSDATAPELISTLLIYRLGCLCSPAWRTPARRTTSWQQCHLSCRKGCHGRPHTGQPGDSFKLLFSPTNHGR